MYQDSIAGNPLKRAIRKAKRAKMGHSPMLHFVRKTIFVDHKSRAGVVYRVPKHIILPKSLEAEFDANQAATK